MLSRIVSDSQVVAMFYPFILEVPRQEKNHTLFWCLGTEVLSLTLTPFCRS